MKMRKCRTHVSRFLLMFYTVDRPDKTLGAQFNFLLNLVVTSGHVAYFTHSFDLTQINCNFNNLLHRSGMLLQYLFNSSILRVVYSATGFTDWMKTWVLGYTCGLLLTFATCDCLNIFIFDCLNFLAANTCLHSSHNLAILA